MLREQSTRRFMMDTECSYLIRVAGELDKRWLQYLQDASIAITTDPRQHTISTIYTHGADQATLMGLLNSLYDFGYPLVYFERVESSQVQTLKE